MLIRSELCIVDLEKVKNNLHFRSVSNSIISPPPYTYEMTQIATVLNYVWY